MHNSLNHYICPITKATNQKPPTVVLLWIIRQVELDHCFFPTFVPIIFPVSCALKIFVGFTYLLWDKYSDLGDRASADFFVTRQSKIHGCGVPIYFRQILRKNAPSMSNPLVQVDSIRTEKYIILTDQLPTWSSNHCCCCCCEQLNQKKIKAWKKNWTFLAPHETNCY